MSALKRLAWFPACSLYLTMIATTITLCNYVISRETTIVILDKMNF